MFHYGEKRVMNFASVMHLFPTNDKNVTSAKLNCIKNKSIICNT